MGVEYIGGRVDGCLHRVRRRRSERDTPPAHPREPRAVASGCGWRGSATRGVGVASVEVSHRLCLTQSAAVTLAPRTPRVALPRHPHPLATARGSLRHAQRKRARRATRNVFRARHDDTNMESEPLAYLITFRTYGTWLHGDPRGTVDRHRNRYGAPVIPSDPSWVRSNRAQLRSKPVSLDAASRNTVRRAIRETCELRAWVLVAVAVRTNHVHAVVASQRTPTTVLVAMKANATRMLRENDLWTSDRSPWSRGGSRRPLWTERAVEAAVDYVLDGQGVELPSA